AIFAISATNAKLERLGNARLQNLTPVAERGGHIVRMDHTVPRPTGQIGYANSRIFRSAGIEMIQSAVDFSLKDNLGNRVGQLAESLLASAQFPLSPFALRDVRPQ